MARDVPLASSMGDASHEKQENQHNHMNVFSVEDDPLPFEEG